MAFRACLSDERKGAPRVWIFFFFHGYWKSGEGKVDSTFSDINGLGFI